MNEKEMPLLKPTTIYYKTPKIFGVKYSKVLTVLFGVILILYAALNYLMNVKGLI